MPVLFTRRTFGHDWTLHLWLLRQQQLNIQSMWHPGLFVSVHTLGVFYPVFAFVGSGLYTMGALLAIVLGDRPILAYRLLYLLGFVLAYGGMTWLSVQLGLRKWRAQMPGLVLVTGAYYLTDLAGRGDLGEFIALSSIPLLLAAGRSIVTAPRLRARDILAAVFATFILTGSHNITLAWGSVFVAALLVVMLASFGSVTLRPGSWSRVGALAGIGRRWVQDSMPGFSSPICATGWTRRSRNGTSDFSRPRLWPSRACCSIRCDRPIPRTRPSPETSA